MHPLGRALGVAGGCGVEVAPDFHLQGHLQQRRQYRHVSACPRRCSFDGRRRLSVCVCVVAARCLRRMAIRGRRSTPTALRASLHQVTTRSERMRHCECERAIDTGELASTKGAADTPSRTTPAHLRSKRHTLYLHAPPRYRHRLRPPLPAAHAAEEPFR